VVNSRRTRRSSINSSALQEQHLAQQLRHSYGLRSYVHWLGSGSRTACGESQSHLSTQQFIPSPFLYLIPCICTTTLYHVDQALYRHSCTSTSHTHSSILASISCDPPLIRSIRQSVFGKERLQWLEINKTVPTSSSPRQDLSQTIRVGIVALKINPTIPSINNHHTTTIYRKRNNRFDLRTPILPHHLRQTSLNKKSR